VSIGKENIGSEEIGNGGRKGEGIGKEDVGAGKLPRKMWEWGNGQGEYGRRRY